MCDGLRPVVCPGVKPDARRVAVCNDGMGVVDRQEVINALRLPPRPVQAALGAQYCGAKAGLKGLYRCSMSSCSKHDLPGGSAGLVPDVQQALRGHLRRAAEHETVLGRASALAGSRGNTRRAVE